MTDQWLVLKFGGTSVSGKRQWATIEVLARQRLEQGYRVVLVCSAMAGVTNALQHIAEQANGHNKNEIGKILSRHRQLATDLGIESEDLLDEAAQRITKSLNRIAGAISNPERYAGIASLLPIGEWLSTRIGKRYLAKTLEIDWVDAREALQSLAEDTLHTRRRMAFRTLLQQI